MEIDEAMQQRDDEITLQDSYTIKSFLGTEDKYRQENYLISIMRYSTIEKAITSYLFHSKGKDFTLAELLDDIKKDSSKSSLFSKYIGFMIHFYDEDCPLFLFNQIASEILRLFREEGSLFNLKIDKRILKTEFLLAWHFENNFYPKLQILDKIPAINDNVYLQKGITNYVYSIQSIDTIEQFLELFERQALATRVYQPSILVSNLFCSEKSYYFYCDKEGKNKLSCGNMVKYLIHQLNTKVDKIQTSKVNVIEIENYILMNLYLINKVVQNYTFYLYKDPELIEIFNSLEQYKTWPCPISNFCNSVMENIINENSFQGISLLNKLRQLYYLDLLDKSISWIDTEDFRYTLVLNSFDSDDQANEEALACFNMTKFLDFLKNRKIKPRRKKLWLKEILVRIFITALFNSNQPFTDGTIKSLYAKYLPNYKQILDGSLSDSESVKIALDKILKIIDVGFDKTVEDYNKDINVIATKVIESCGYGSGGDAEDNVIKNKFFLPINSMRNYLKPDFTEFKKLARDNTVQGDNIVNIFDSYIRIFKNIVTKYFSFLLTTSNDPLIEANLKTMRRNFYENFRINIFIIEKENTINSLIDSMQKTIFSVLDSKISEDEFNNFWKFFVDDNKSVMPKYLLFIAPYYEKFTSNPFRLLTEETSLKNKESFLSEFIANNDYIYKNLIFLPFASVSDPLYIKEVSKASQETSSLLEKPSLKVLYSFLTKPLDDYLGDSNGIFDLDLYKVTIFDKTKESGETVLSSKIFWKNIEFIDKSFDNSYTKTTQTTLKMKYVDSLGLEFKEEKEIKLGSNDFYIKIFNLFYKNNVPFNYNMSSNNGWLEMFLDDKYDFEEVDKFCNFQSFLELNKESKFYEEFNMPQTDIESRFKNYKIKSLTIETNTDTMVIRCDENMDMQYSEIDLTNCKKNGTMGLRIQIEPFTVKDKRYSIPVATFTTI